MFLCSAESVNDLEKMVVPLFKEIKNKNMKTMKYSFAYHPWGPKQLKRKIHIVIPDAPAEVLRLTFPVPDVRKQYRTSVSFEYNKYGMRAK